MQAATPKTFMDYGSLFCPHYIETLVTDRAHGPSFHFSSICMFFFENLAEQRFGNCSARFFLMAYVFIMASHVCD
ncbi:hypothetical protein CHCC20335_2948 [Bacillus paralicheniformis]|nr:hypothetical protein CHCC20335_2948 [Bacillus paralicheniformis]